MKNTYYRNLTALFLATLVLLNVRICPALAETENNNLIQNSGFEATETLAADWAQEPGMTYEVKNEAGSVVSSYGVTDEMADSNGGNGYAFKITNTEKNLNVWAKQKLLTTKHGIIPGATYRLTYRIYAELGARNDSGVGCFLAFYSENSESHSYYLSGTEILYPDSTTNARWSEISGTFVFPPDAKMLRILLRSYAVGTVYYDDVSLELVDAEKFQFYASHVFHYTAEDHGTAKVSLLPYYHDGIHKIDPQTLHANFAIYDGSKKITGQNNVSFSNFEATYTYSVDALQTKGKKYTLSVTVLDAKNSELDSFSQSLYKYDRPNFLDTDGNFRGTDGKIVPPFIAFHLSSSYFDEAKAAGFTMYQMTYDCAIPENETYRNDMMNAAEKAGLYGLFTLYVDMKAAAHPDNIENTKKIVEMYKNDKRFLGWVVQDEPLGGGITEEAKALLELSYKTIRDIDPNHPIILTDYRRDVFKETVKYCDIFIPNSYGRDYSGVRTYVEESVKYSHGRPVYPNICAYSGTSKLDGLPTGKQVQHFIYQAFLGGAKGVSVYAVNDPVTKPYRIPLFKTAVWEPMADTGNTELPTLFDLFVYGEENPESLKTADYSQKKWTRPDGDYYFLLSTSDANQTLEYALGEGKSVRLLGGDSTEYLTLSGGTLSVSLSSGDGLFFKVCDSKSCISVEQDGIGIKNTVADVLSVSAPASTKHLMTCLYETVDGREKIVRMKVAEGNTMEFTVSPLEKQFAIRVFAWDAGLHPIATAIKTHGN